MTIRFQSHGKTESSGQSGTSGGIAAMAGNPPAPGDVSVDEAADFGYFFPHFEDDDSYLPVGQPTVDELDQLGNLMVEQGADDVDSDLVPVLTYWGQFLDHELTARTDRDSSLTGITGSEPTSTHGQIESGLKNARTPRFDLDSVYGGTPVGAGITTEMTRVISALRNPDEPEKMREGQAHFESANHGPLPDTLDVHRDLPRYSQVDPSVQSSALDIARAGMSAKEFEGFSSNIHQRALIGDMRNDENLLVAQFHVSFLRFHNRVVNFLRANDTGWVPDFHSAQVLTRLHYQWLIVEGYLKKICDNDVLQGVIDSRASHFRNFRIEYEQRNNGQAMGNSIPLEFSAAIFRFGHSMVRMSYDYNRIFGRSPDALLDDASFELLFAFTGDGGMRQDPSLPALPANWIVDWTRFTGIDPVDGSDGKPARLARKIDTKLALPLGTMINQGNDQGNPIQINELLKHLARRNLRRGYDLRLPTGQALHNYLVNIEAVNSSPIENTADLFPKGHAIQELLTNSNTELYRRTPLWFYCLAEAEASPGQTLGTVGSWIVASTFIGVLLADAESALSIEFDPANSPLTMPDGSLIDSIDKWFKFAEVME